MTRVTFIALSAWIAALGLSACSTDTSQLSVSYQRYTYTCCQASDTQRAWVPGETLTLHWIAQPAGTTPDNSAARITLTAVLTGPYPNVNALKAGGSPRVTLSATPIVTTDRANTNAASSIALPTSLPAGFYNVANSMELASSKASGATVIQVSPTGG
jgi:hypothetical protein